MCEFKSNQNELVKSYSHNRLSSWPQESKKLLEKLLDDFNCREGWALAERDEFNQETPVRWFTTATGDKMFLYSYFINPVKGRGEGLCVWGMWTEGETEGFVHSGAVSAIHDSFGGHLANAVYGADMLTACMNVNFDAGIRLGQTTRVHTSVEEVSGRKIWVSCKITSHDDRVVFSDARMLFVGPRVSPEGKL